MIYVIWGLCMILDIEGVILNTSVWSKVFSAAAGGVILGLMVSFLSFDKVDKAAREAFAAADALIEAQNRQIASLRARYVASLSIKPRPKGK